MSDVGRCPWCGGSIVSGHKSDCPELIADVISFNFATPPPPVLNGRCPTSGYCMLCNAAPNQHHADDCRHEQIAEVGALTCVVTASIDTVVTMIPKRPMVLGEMVEVDGGPIGVVAAINDDGTVDVHLAGGVYAPHDTGKCRERWANADPMFEPGDFVYIDGEPVSDIQRHKAECPECKGAGFYESPLTGKRSPCSMGCRS